MLTHTDDLCSVTQASTGVNGAAVGDGGSLRAATETARAYTAGGPALEAGPAPVFPGGSEASGEADGDGRPGAAGPSSSLDTEHKTARKLAVRQKRCFHRVMSGLERGGDFRVMMLTSTSPVAGPVQAAWRALKERLRRRGVLHDYIRVPEYTESGLVHLHVIYRGSYLSQWVLSQQWYALTQSQDCGAKVVYIQRVYGKRGIAHYLAKYMGKGDEYLAGNMSWSWGWVWQGFVRDWKYLVHAWRCARNGFNEWAHYGWDLPYGALLKQWRWHLQAGIPP